jgi:metal-responsive CopG/Arc/MetJ family transcriptional regulator
MKLISLKLPEEMVERFEQAAATRRVSRSSVLREALADYLDRMKPERSVSALDLAGELVGSVKGGPDDLSTNPDYMADYGK